MTDQIKVKVNLYVKDKKSGELHFVKEVETLPFNPMPDIINWGSRFFIHETDDKYIEGFVITAFTE